MEWKELERIIETKLTKTISEAGGIIDPRQNDNDWHNVEDIINTLIKYFLEKNEGKKSIKKKQDVMQKEDWDYFFKDLIEFQKENKE